MSRVAINGTGGDDTLTALNQGHEFLLRGLGGDDSLTGAKNDDILKGGGGEDLLSGSGGDDRLIGGAGGDRLFGGEGNDTFVFTTRASTFSPGGYDVVGALDSGDILDLTKTKYALSDLTFQTLGDATVIRADFNGDGDLTDVGRDMFIRVNGHADATDILI